MTIDADISTARAGRPEGGGIICGAENPSSANVGRKLDLVRSRLAHSSSRYRFDEQAEALTDRQLECLRWISRGKSSTDIGAILGISGRTVDYHVAIICDRLAVRTRMQAVARAIQLGWLTEL